MLRHCHSFIPSGVEGPLTTFSLFSIACALFVTTFRPVSFIFISLRTLLANTGGGVHRAKSDQTNQQLTGAFLQLSPIFDLPDFQTFRHSDLPTSRTSDLQTFRLPGGAPFAFPRKQANNEDASSFKKRWWVSLNFLIHDTHPAPSRISCGMNRSKFKLTH